MGYDARAMSQTLGIDYDQYRHYYYGHCKIPADLAEKVLAAHWKVKWATEATIRNITRRIDRDWPGGIMSEVVED
jgi:hypothetical protein